MQNYFPKGLRETFKFTWNEVDNWHHLTVSFRSEKWDICLFFLLQMWTIKLTELTNNFCTSERAVRTVKLVLKERFIGNDGFLQIFMWWINREQNNYYLTILGFSGRRTDSCYFVSTLRTIWTYVNQGWCYKVLQCIRSWKMNLSTFSYPLKNVKRFVT